MAPRKLLKKTLTKTDVSKRMNFPTKKLNHLPSFQNGLRGVDLLIDDETGHAYPVRCTIRQQGHKKSVLSTGWTKFVRDLGLEAADEVTFFKLGVGHLKLQVKKPNEEVDHLPADDHDHEPENNNATDLDTGNNDRQEEKNEIINEEDGKAFKVAIKVFGAVIGYMPAARRPITLFGSVIGWAIA